jgi:hypothetical protein
MSRRRGRISICPMENEKSVEGKKMLSLSL